MDASQLKQYRKTQHWEAKRREAVEAYNYTCADCGVSLQFSEANVHHSHYKCLWRERVGIDIVPLCRECHLARHRTIYTDKVKAPYFDERD